MLVLQTVGMPFSNASFIWSQISIGSILSTNLKLSVGTSWEIIQYKYNIDSHYYYHHNQYHLILCGLLFSLLLTLITIVSGVATTVLLNTRQVFSENVPRKGATSGEYRAH